MEDKATHIKNVMTLDLIIEILEERGILTAKELNERLTNNVKLSALDNDLKQAIIEKTKH